jgi:membrane-bound lytic murein transglycosylase D
MDVNAGEKKDPPAACFPSLMDTIRFDRPLFFCGERVPIENDLVREKLEKEMLLAVWNRPQVILWLKRSGRYFPHIEKMLREAGAPDDLKYIAVVESGLRPHAGSYQGAVGFWQFMSLTGSKFGLTITPTIDERRNIFASTQAAIRYLHYLHYKFGSWSLAAAAYNMGEDRLKSDMEIQQTDDYYKLYLFLETQHYVFKVIAAKEILSDRGRFGFDLKETDLYPPLEFDRVTIKGSRELPLLMIAQAAGTDTGVIKEFNPEIRGYHLPEGEHALLIPKGAGEMFQSRFQRLFQEWRFSSNEKYYVVRPGDNLTLIARRLNVPLDALMKWNSLGPRDNIRPDKRLKYFSTQ